MFKESKYNFLLYYDSRPLLYNGVTGNGFCMSEDEWALLRKMLDRPDEFSNLYPDDFKRLKRMGYIVDDDFDETSWLLYKNKMEVYSDRDYMLIVNPTLECNFRCWYCYENHSDGRMSPSMVTRVKKHIKLKVEREHIPALSISWFGGEPLLCFDSVVYPVSLYARNLCRKNNIPCHLSITTNGYLLNGDMIPKIKKIGLESFQITLDGDKAKHDKVRRNGKEPSYDRIVENIRTLCSELDDVSVTLRINYDNSTFTRYEIFDILNEFAPSVRDRININLQKVWQVASNVDESPHTLLNEFMDKAFEMGYPLTMGGGINKGICHSCYASRSAYANINYDGAVFKCTARDYTDSNAMGRLNADGNIAWDVKKISKAFAVTPIENTSCMECKYLPLCGGQCIQKHIEKGFFCVHPDKTLLESEIIRQYRNNIIAFNARAKKQEP